MAQLCLKWNNYEQSLTQSFQELYEAERHVDVTLACDGQHVKAHKIVLESCSPYFQSLFMANPCKHPIVIMHGVRFDDLKALLVFMYSGEVTVMHEQLPSLLKTAETLQIKQLSEMTQRPAQLDNQVMRGPKNKKRSRKRPARLGETSGGESEVEGSPAKTILHGDATVLPAEVGPDGQIITTSEQNAEARSQILELSMSVAEVVGSEGVSAEELGEGDATDGEGTQVTLHTNELGEITGIGTTAGLPANMMHDDNGILVFRKKQSFVWEYFSETGKGSVKCKKCAKLLSYKDTSGSTSNMIKHLKTVHGVERAYKAPLQE